MENDTEQPRSIKIKILASILLALSTTSVGAEPMPELTVYYYERMPFFGDKNGIPSGVLIDISKLIFAEADIKYKYINMPVRRFFELLKETENACVLGALKTKEREAIYIYSEDFIYRDQPFRIIINSTKRPELSEQPSIKNILESNLTLGVTDGYSYGSWLDNNIANYKPKFQKINIGNDTARMHKMIIGERFDYMFAVSEEAKYVLENNPDYTKKLSIVKIADAPNGNMRYIVCSKETNKDIMYKINIAIKRTKASENYKKLIARYN